MEIRDGIAYLDEDETRISGLPEVIHIDSFPDLHTEFIRDLHESDLSLSEVSKLLSRCAILRQIEDEFLPDNSQKVEFALGNLAISEDIKL